MKSLSLLFLILIAACTKDNLPEFNRLEGLRILAFQTPTPEVKPGDPVTITPIVSDINATSLSYSASACLDLGISYGASPTCEGNPSKRVLASNTALNLPGPGESWTGLADSFTFNVPVEAVIFAGRAAHETYNGVNYLVEYTLTNNQGSSVTSIKRIVVSETAKTPNQNPSTSVVYANGAPMTSLSLGGKVILSTDLTNASAETFTLKNASLEPFVQTEKLTTTWFVTDGETKYYRSAGVETNEFTAPGTSPVGRKFYLLALTRDDRGGVSLVKKSF